MASNAAITRAADPAGAIAEADAQATVLDDRHYVEDRAVYLWLRAHQLPGRGLNHLVMGSRRQAPLPPTWPHRTFANLRDADAFLERVARDRAALSALKRLGRELQPQATGESAPQIAAALAPSLLSGEIWATEVMRAPPRPYITKTDPAVFARLNPKFGTSIDFAYIGRLEGDQWLRGYVPMNKAGTIGRSGMTVATGFDIGQWSLRQIQDMGFSPTLTAKLTPFAGVPFAHLHPGKSATPMSKAEVVALVAKLGPVPELSKAEADLCDEVVFGKILQTAAADWNRLRAQGVPEFTRLPAGWQTVWLSRNYQEGRAGRSAAAKTFRAQALAGDWEDAVKALRSYTQYLDRATQEAKLLEAALPPAVVKPGKPGAAPAPAAKPITLP